MNTRSAVEPDNGLTGAAVPERVRRRLPAAARRALLAVAGLALASGSVAGFWYTAEAFDDRTRVAVAASDIAAGQVLASEDVTWAWALLDGVAHIAWTPDTGHGLAGLTAVGVIPAGTLISPHLLAAVPSQPVGDELEVVVPVDASLAPSGVADGDLVLLVDPGVAPSGDGPGRPRQVLRSLVLRGFDGSAMRLYVPPEEWAWWRGLPSALGATPMVLPVPLGGDAEGLVARLDTLWGAEHADATAALHPFGDDWLAQGAPGELEVLVPIDTSLAASGVAEGDLVLLVDPGAPASGGTAGRPRSVLRAVTLDHYRDNVLGIWAKPAEWAWWEALPVRLGAAPMALRVTPGTDAGDVAQRLNEQWLTQWQQSGTSDATQ